jgi:hypothetical protein
MTSEQQNANPYWRALAQEDLPPAGTVVLLGKWLADGSWYWWTQPGQPREWWEHYLLHDGHCYWSDAPVWITQGPAVDAAKRHAANLIGQLIGAECTQLAALPTNYAMLHLFELALRAIDDGDGRTVHPKLIARAALRQAFGPAYKKCPPSSAPSAADGLPAESSGARFPEDFESATVGADHCREHPVL